MSRRARSNVPLAGLFLLLATLACGGGPAPLRSGRLERLGEVHPGQPVVPELAVFRGELYAASAVDPLHTPGAALSATRDGRYFRRCIEAPEGEGFLRLRVFDGQLWVPDADPPGYVTGRILASADGRHFREMPVPDAVHVFDVAAFAGRVYVATGAPDGRGVLVSADAAGAEWAPVAALPVQRLRDLVVFRDRLLAAREPAHSPAEYFSWSAPPGQGEALAHDALPGQAGTWRWYVTSRGELFWSVLARGGRTQVWRSSDGERWQPVVDLAAHFVSGFAELDGNLYALGVDGVLGSVDHRHFRRVAPAPDASTFAPLRSREGVNGDASAGIVAWQGALWLGSTHDGRLYRLR